MQLALAFLLGVATSLLAVQSFGFWRWTGRPSERAVIYRVNLNRAERAELVHLPGVGEALAQRIEEHRAARGHFRSVDELRAVPGIGPTTLEQLRPWVYVDSAEEREVVESRSESGVTAEGMVTGPRKVTAADEPIDVNRASAEELQRLPGIGPKLSQRIVEERKKGLFRSAEDLRRVSGIGVKTVERLRPLITTGKPTTVTRAD